MIAKIRELISYIFFGALTTVTNITSFFICVNILGFNYIISNILAWFISVLFAFISNKLFVFSSKNNYLKEILLFYLSRILSLVIESVVLFVLINGLNTDVLISKIITNILVIIINYFISKFIIFKK